MTARFERRRSSGNGNRRQVKAPLQALVQRIDVESRAHIEPPKHSLPEPRDRENIESSVEFAS